MALNIPMPDLPGNALMKGLNTGSTLFARYMQPIIQREQLAEQGKYHQSTLAQQQQHMAQQQQQFLQDLALRKQQEQRMGANSVLNRQILEQELIKLQHSNNPKLALQQLQNKLDYIQNLGANQKNAAGVQNMNQQQSQEQQRAPNFIQGQDAQQLQEQQNRQSGEQKNQLPSGLDMDEIKRALTYQALGLKPPELKRANDLKSKMMEAEYKHNLKLEEQRTANELKNQQTRQKVIDSARNDLPHLEETLRSLKIMQKIADDPGNKDLFGHWIEGHDTAAKRTSNPNAGPWQIYGLDPIVNAEMKMSSRANQLALKTALNNKPNFAESQSVASAKIKASIDKIQRQIKQTKRISSEGSNSSGSVIVIDPSGKRFETTAANAAHLPKGWSHG